MFFRKPICRALTFFLAITLLLTYLPFTKSYALDVIPTKKSQEALPAEEAKESQQEPQQDSADKQEQNSSEGIPPPEESPSPAPVPSTQHQPQDPLQATPEASAEAGEYTAKGAILMEQSTGQILFAQNCDEQLAPASLTKIMDLILIMEEIQNERLSLDDMLTCSEYAKSMGGSEIWLKVGEQMSVDDLLKALFVASANDAAVVFAEAISSTEEAFVKKMNQKAKDLGLKNTNFVNCTGFDEEGHYTSARDVAIMARELMKYDLVTKYSTIWMDTLRGGETELVNTNRLVRFYKGTTGLKTGTTDKAGHCLCATATRNDLSLISVIMGCQTGDVRFEESKQLLDYGFSEYTLYVPEPIDDQLVPIKVTRGVLGEVSLNCNEQTGTILKIEDIPQIEQKLTLPESVEAPIEEGQEIGKLSILVGEKEVASYPIKAAGKVERLNFWRSFVLLVKGFFDIV